MAVAVVDQSSRATNTELFAAGLAAMRDPASPAHLVQEEPAETG
jgi:hypothetical protein